jgi:putative tryptophan/tyrosine transport system substrate-binding protein
MRRREFITLLGGAAVSWPLAARAQQPAMPVIGYLRSDSPEASPKLRLEFTKGLAETGYVEGRNVTIEYRWAEGHYDRLPELATDLVRRQVAVIVTPGNTPAALAAKAATATIPIIFSFGADPVKIGLVASLDRPGGNATGFGEMNIEVAPKRLGILHELIPRAARFGLLLEPKNSPTTPADVTELQAAAEATGLQVEVVYATATVGELETAFSSLAQKRVDALMVNPSPQFASLRVQLAALAAHHAIPTIYWDRRLVDAGGLMSYGSNVEDLFRKVGVYAGRILKGEKPSDMPVQQATKFDFVINLKAAKALDLTVPPTLLARADDVIE